MDFDAIIDRLKNRNWIPMSDIEAVDMIVKANMDGNIDDDEKGMLLDMV